MPAKPLIRAVYRYRRTISRYFRYRRADIRYLPILKTRFSIYWNSLCIKKFSLADQLNMANSSSFFYSLLSNLKPNTASIKNEMLQTIAKRAFHCQSSIHFCEEPALQGSFIHAFSQIIKDDPCPTKETFYLGRRGRDAQILASHFAQVGKINLIWPPRMRRNCNLIMKRMIRQKWKKI